MTIFLCGFMGCGKSTIGEKLAQKLNCNFIDMDDYIEQKANMTIPEIFEQFGEPHFRDLETQAVKELSTSGGCHFLRRRCNAPRSQRSNCQCTWLCRSA